jgi:DNA-binding MarR family transcriptional regulator
MAITPRGRALFRSVAPESEEIYDAVEREFGAKRLGELYQLLDRLIEALVAGEVRAQAVPSQKRRR